MRVREPESTAQTSAPSNFILNTFGDVLESNIHSGSGNDNLNFNGDVLNSIVHSGSDNDFIAFNGLLAEGFVDTGSGNDYVSLNGEINNSEIKLGQGDDIIDSRYYCPDDSSTAVFYGNRGNDILNGGAGDEVMYGGADDDILAGGGGINQLFGGAGNDLFVLVSDDGHSSIKDFEIGIDEIMVVGSSPVTTTFDGTNTLFFNGSEHFGTVEGALVSASAPGMFI